MIETEVDWRTLMANFDYKKKEMLGDIVKGQDVL